MTDKYTLQNSISNFRTQRVTDAGRNAYRMKSSTSHAEKCMPHIHLKVDISTRCLLRKKLSILVEKVPLRGCICYRAMPNTFKLQIKTYVAS